MGLKFTKTIFAVTLTENYNFANITEMYNHSKNSIIGNAEISKPLKYMYFLGIFAFVFLALTMFFLFILTFQDKLLKGSKTRRFIKGLSCLFTLMTILLAVSYYGVFMNKLNPYNLKFSGSTITGLVLIIIAGAPTITNSSLLIFKK